MHPSEAVIPFVTRAWELAKRIDSHRDDNARWIVSNETLRLFWMVQVNHTSPIGWDVDSGDLTLFGIRVRGERGVGDNDMYLQLEA